MRTRPLAGFAILVLLTVYGALPCFALASAGMSRPDDAMPMADAGAAADDGEQPMDGCDAGSAQAILLCAAPTVFAPISAAPAVPTFDGEAPRVDACAAIAASVTTPSPMVAATARRATPVFLLHATLLI